MSDTINEKDPEFLQVNTGSQVEFITRQAGKYFSPWGNLQLYLPQSVSDRAKMR